MAAEEAIAALGLLKIEEESAFATENGAHSWEHVRAIDPELAKEEQVHRRRERLQRLTQHPGRVRGRRGGRLTFGHYMAGAGTALSATASTANDTLQKLLKACMGNSHSGAGSTAVAGATSTVVEVQAGHGDRFKPGTAIMLEGTGDDGENEISIVASISTDTLTLEIATTNAIAENGKIWNGYTAYIDPSASTTLQAQLVGEATADIYLALGLIGGLSFENLLQLNDSAAVNFDLMITNWDEDSATLIPGSYDEPSPADTAEELQVHWQNHGTATRNTISLSDLSVEPNITWTQHFARGNGDKQHVDRVKMTGGPAVGSGPTATFTADIDSAFMTAYETPTKKMLALMYGNTPGASWCICLPRCEIDALPGRVVHSEQTATQVVVEAHENDSGDASEAVMRSPMFITRL